MYQSLPWGTSREYRKSLLVVPRGDLFFAWRKWGIAEQQE
jgi:hypothetical protein